MSTKVGMMSRGDEDHNDIQTEAIVHVHAKFLTTNHTITKRKKY